MSAELLPCNTIPACYEWNFIGGRGRRQGIVKFITSFRITSIPTHPLPPSLPLSYLLKQTTDCIENNLTPSIIKF